MGARGKNFYNDIMCAYGWESEAKSVQDLYLDGHKEQAAAAVPRDYLASASLVGPRSYVRERVAAYASAGVTYLQLGLVGSLEDKVATVEAMRAMVDG